MCCCATSRCREVAASFFLVSRSQLESRPDPCLRDLRTFGSWEGFAESLGEPEDLVLAARGTDDLKADRQAVDEASGDVGRREAEPVEHMRVTGVMRRKRLVGEGDGPLAGPSRRPVLDLRRQQLRGRA